VKAADLVKPRTARRAGARGCRALFTKNGVSPVDEWIALFNANAAIGRNELQEANDVA
jgi:hypothetical protein